MVSGDFVTTGGMDRANYALADFLLRMGTDVDLVTHRVANTLTHYPKLALHIVPKPLGSYFLGERFIDREGRRLAKQVLENGGRVVVNGGNCIFGDVNWVHYVHAAYRPQIRSISRRMKQFIERPLLLKRERLALLSAKTVITNSNQTKTAVEQAYGISNNRIKTIYYGTDANRFRPASLEERSSLRANFDWDESPRVVFIGALGDRRKGFDILIEAWETLVTTKRWDAKLVVIGAGVEKATWQKRVTESGIDHSVSFLGFREDVDQILKAADCLVAPTRYEAYGLGVHEALCCGLPALVSADAGVAERYPQSLAWMKLPNPSTSKVLADRLIQWRSRLCDVAPEIHRFGEKLRQRTWDNMAQDFLEFVL